LYAGTSGGVYRSTDGGENWEAASVGLEGVFVSSLVMDSRDGTLYAGTSGGVYRSTDGGGNWEAANVGLEGVSTNSVVIDNRDDTLYASTSSGVYRSTDGGENWEAANVGLEGVFVSSLVMDSRDGTLYARTSSGVYRLTDGGENWEAASVGLEGVSTNSFVIDNRDGTLYAGTSGGVYRSTDGGENWEAANVGLPAGVSTNSLVIDSRDSTLYASVGNGVYRSTDGGENWEAANVGVLTSTVSTNTFVIDNRDGTLYASVGNGVYRSTDGGENWEAASVGLEGVFVSSLVMDSEDSTLYAGTSGGVYRSTDGGGNWEAANVGLSGRPVISFIIDTSRQSGTLYAGTYGGVYRSTDGGENWEAASVGLEGVFVSSLVMDSRDGTLYASVGNGVYRSTDGGGNWEAASVGLEGVFVSSLVMDSRDGTLYAGTSGGVYRSTDGGGNWEAANVGLEGVSVSSLVMDSRDGTLYARTSSGVYRSTDGGENWQIADTSLLGCLYPMYPGQEKSALLTVSNKNNLKIWTSDTHCGIFSMIERKLVKPFAQLAQLDQNKYVIYQTWGGTLHYLRLHSDLNSLHPSIMFVHMWLAENFLSWLHSYMPQLMLMLIAIAVIWLLVDYFRWSRPLGIPLWALILARPNLSPYIKKELFTDVWRDWSLLIHNELINYGNALPVDLLSIPAPLRKFAIAQYFKENKDNLIIEKRNNRISILTADRLNRWILAWNRAGREMRDTPGLTPAARIAVTQMAHILSSVLGVSLERQEDHNVAQTYMVTAPTLRLHLPHNFPLIFVSDPQPRPRTLQELVDIVTIIKDQSNFALIVPIEPFNRQLDIPNELRNAILNTPYSQDLVVLSRKDIEDILIARQPNVALARKIGQQVDLTFISPFVVNGPVPENMFFGRESEVQLLVKNAKERDFAIVGNRKIGKTSLLNRIERRLSLESDLELIRLDCQSVKSLRMLYDLLERELSGPVNTVNSFLVTVRLRRTREKNLVFLIDEIDAVLSLGNNRGGSIVSAWRTLAQEGTCHFIFCGTTFLARSLRNAESAMFNFPEPLTLGYLSRNEVDLILTQPFETLGIVLNDQNILLQAIWDLTSGHPNLTQYVGKTLVNEANRRQLHDIFPDDVGKIRSSTEFVDFFFDTIWGGANSLEKIITLIAPSSNFSATDIERLLIEHNIDMDSAQIDEALRMLVIYSILFRDGRYYQFIPKAFTDLRDQNLEVERVISIEKKKISFG
jgi:photosystem II stability/assembly factor-like uncharacterized protein